MTVDVSVGASWTKKPGMASYVLTAMLFVRVVFDNVRYHN